jgi:hypothetical protein
MQRPLRWELVLVETLVVGVCKPEIVTALLNMLDHQRICTGVECDHTVSNTTGYVPPVPRVTLMR